MLRTVGYKAGNLGFLVIGPEVKMKSTLARLALVDSDEIQPRLAIRLRADLEFLASGVDHHPPQSLRPPFPKGYRVQRVDDHLFPFQSHQPSLSACTVPAMNINPHRCPGHPPVDRLSDLAICSSTKAPMLPANGRMIGTNSATVDRYFKLNASWPKHR
jgi:hypothetical protein